MNSLTNHRVIIGFLVLILLVVNVIMPAIQRRKAEGQAVILQAMVDEIGNKGNAEAKQIAESYAPRLSPSYASTAGANIGFPCATILAFLENQNIRISIGFRMRLNDLYEENCVG